MFKNMGRILLGGIASIATIVAMSGVSMACSSYFHETDAPEFLKQEL